MQIDPSSGNRSIFTEAESYDVIHRLAISFCLGRSSHSSSLLCRVYTVTYAPSAPVLLEIEQNHHQDKITSHN